MLGKAIYLTTDVTASDYISLKCLSFLDQILLHLLLYNYRIIIRFTLEEEVSRVV